jgi:hypothetical protein
MKRYSYIDFKIDDAKVRKFDQNKVVKVFQELDYAAGMTAQALADSIPGSDLNDVQKALNALESD